MGKYSFSDDQDKRREERRPVPKPRKPITKKSNATVSIKVRSLMNTDENKFLQNQAAENFQALQNFFAEAAKIIEKHPYCQECGKFIPQKYYRAATAHVLPKRKEYGFPSVATHFDNFLMLGSGCGCHQKYDRTWEEAATMKVFPLAVVIFLKLYPLLTQEEKKNIPEVFLQELQPK